MPSIPGYRCLDAWTSPDAHVAVAGRLVGDAGHDRLQEWLNVQIDRRSDPEFARLFAEHAGILGIGLDAFSNRLVEDEGLRVLGGIRFLGGDTARPFVDVIAWTDFTGQATSDRWGRLKFTIAQEWRAFQPNALRLLLPSEDRLPEGATLDMTVHAESFGSIAAHSIHIDHVRVIPLLEAAFAARIAKKRYDQLLIDAPELARAIKPASQEELEECAAQERLFTIMAKETAVGVLATKSGAVEWVAGDEVMEIVVEREHAGKGYAAKAQRARARLMKTEPRRLLVGAIDARNGASRKAAMNAGRPIIMRYAFMPLAP